MPEEVVVKIGVIVPSNIAEWINFQELFDTVYALGFEGVGFRSIIQLSATLDQSKLNAIRQYADELGLFLDFDLGWLNPFNAPTSPELWAIGEGDYCRALYRQLLAAHQMGCREIVGKIAGVKGPYNGLYAFDRFRTDICWEEQLRASEKLILKISPMLTDFGIRIDLENHEDLTSHELLRFVETIGPDRLGFSLDVANLPVLGEAPNEGALRMAPYVHLAHIKDIYLMHTEKGLLRQIRPAGDGIIEWELILPRLYQYDPNIHLLVEDHKGLIQIDLNEPTWQVHYPKLNQNEIETLNRLAIKSGQKVINKEIEDPQAYEAVPYANQRDQRIAQSLAFLKNLREKYELWDQ
jgi:sugar phosphate isomerase/epimerase